ncbi:MAG: DUF4065 domain-containing protein [Oscillospiraceae bacterium]|jgi:uncharacterized phage-associated protein|nr:DUF4065 domain-containing protein [Oscillospiraceae bacterium]
MISVHEAANTFVYFALNGGDEPCTNMRLNKLLYFAQGHALERFGKPLFAADFEAWDFGPVVPEIYRKYKCCGDNPIAATDDGFDPGVLPPEVQDLLAEVSVRYENLSTSALVKLSHRKGSPWFNAPRNEAIPIDAIGNWFSQSEPPLKSVNDLLKERGIVAREATLDMWRDDEDDDCAEGESGLAER